MPLSPTHKLETRNTIVEAARILFNRHGFEGVSIDDIMKAAGLTRGGFYNHFKTKEALYAEAVTSFLMGRGSQWRKAAGITPESDPAVMAQQMLTSYLSAEHLGDIDGQCPMIALPSDVARAHPDVQASYQRLLEAMVGLFEKSLAASVQTPSVPELRQKALSMAALCVGGMVLARSLPDSALASEVRVAALEMATELTAHGSP